MTTSKKKTWKEAQPLAIEVTVLEMADERVRGIEGISLECIPNGKEPTWEKKAWVTPLKDGMEVEPNIMVLRMIVDITIVPR